MGSGISVIPCLIAVVLSFGNVDFNGCVNGGGANDNPSPVVAPTTSPSPVTAAPVNCVVDTTPPIAKCIDFVYQFDATKDGTDEISVGDIDDGSFDSCGDPVDLTSLIPNAFTCADANMEKEVELFVMDTSGNSASCTATVLVNFGRC